MIKTKKLISGMFLTLCLVLSLVVLSTFNNNAAFAEEIENEGMELNLEFVGGGKLQASATAKQGYVYQYWIKTKLVTDESSNLANEQYIWQCLTDHDGSATKLIDVTANDVDQYGRYNVIVRIKEGSEIIDVIYRSYAKAGISEVRVNDETVNGEIIVSKNSVAKIQILSDSDVNQYSLYLRKYRYRLFQRNR